MCGRTANRVFKFWVLTKRSELLKCNGNTNAIWKIINNCLPRKKHPCPNVPDNPVALANKFNKYFTSVGCVTTQKASDLATEHNFDINPTTTVPTPDECPEIFQFHAVSDKDVESVIRGFASNKAPGYDKVSVRVLQDSLPATLPEITTIMNNSFNTKTFSRSRKIAEVTLVLKSGDSEEPCDHKPISLLPVLSKVSERLAHRQFVDPTSSKESSKV